MICIFNRKELLICTTLKRCDEICSALDRTNIPYKVKSTNRTSPSIFAAGTRERMGTFGQNIEMSWIYTIYVKRNDWDTAKAYIK